MSTKSAYIVPLVALLMGALTPACSSHQEKEQVKLGRQAVTVEAWSEGRSYSVGDVVSFQGQTYRALQAHTAWAGAGWTPLAVPSLWEVYAVEQEVPPSGSPGTLGSRPRIEDVVLENDCTAAPETCCPRGSTVRALTDGADNAQILAPASCVIAGHGADTLFVQSSGPSALHAGPGNDTVMVGPGDDLVMAGDGNDTINAWSSADGGTNLFFGGAGDDTVMVANGTNTVIWHGMTRFNGPLSSMPRVTRFEAPATRWK